jgi:hypothetical protein
MKGFGIPGSFYATGEVKHKISWRCFEEFFTVKPLRILLINGRFV